MRSLPQSTTPTPLFLSLVLTISLFANKTPHGRTTYSPGLVTMEAVEIIEHFPAEVMSEEDSLTVAAGKAKKPPGGRNDETKGDWACGEELFGGCPVSESSATKKDGFAAH